MDVTRNYIKNDIRQKKDIFIKTGEAATVSMIQGSDETEELLQVKLDDKVKRGKSPSKAIKRKAGQLFVDKEDWDKEGKRDVAAGKQSQLDIYIGGGDKRRRKVEQVNTTGRT